MQISRSTGHIIESHVEGVCRDLDFTGEGARRDKSRALRMFLACGYFKMKGCEAAVIGSTVNIKHILKTPNYLVSMTIINWQE